MMNNYEKALRAIKYKTIYRFLEEEEFEVTDFVMRGICFIIRTGLDLENGDSNCSTMLDRMSKELYIKVYWKFELSTKVVDYENVSLDFTKVKVFSKPMNKVTSKVIYAEINNKLLW